MYWHILNSKLGNRCYGIYHIILKVTSNNSKFVTPASYQVRGKLRWESSIIRDFWIPAFAGMTFLEVALKDNFPKRFCLLILLIIRIIIQNTGKGGIYDSRRNTRAF